MDRVLSVPATTLDVVMASAMFVSFVRTGDASSGPGSAETWVAPVPSGGPRDVRTPGLTTGSRRLCAASAVVGLQLFCSWDRENDERRPAGRRCPIGADRAP